MHKEVHFGGNWGIMIDYYLKDSAGINEEFTVEEIERLAALDPQLPEFLLPDIDKARRLYLDLRDAGESPIRDLILSESEDPQAEMAAVVEQGPLAIRALLDLVTADTFYSTLAPGFGRAPLLAAECLARIGDKEAIPALFEAVGSTEDFFIDETMIDSLHKLDSEPFLLGVMQQMPWTRDNEKAAMILTHYPEDAQKGEIALSLLEQGAPPSPYLIYLCAGLEDPLLRERFTNLTYHPDLIEEVQFVVREWGLSPL